MTASVERVGRRSAVVRAFIASRWSPTSALALLAAVGLSIVVAPHTYQQPFSTLAGPLPAAPLAPALPALLVGFAFTNNMSVLERVVGRRLVLSRIAWAVAMLAAMVLAAAGGAAVVDSPMRLVMIRNAAGLTGLALLAALVVGSRIAWIAVLAPVVAMIVAGHDGATGTAYRWALLMQPRGSVPAFTVAVVLAAAGLAGYAYWDTRPILGIVRE